MNGFSAAIFDMDGVVTNTAAVHSRAWKRMFDEFLLRRERAGGDRFREFTPDSDYRVHVDGKPRYDGVQSFLASRGIRLPFGRPQDAPNAETVCGLGNRKNELFNEIIVAEGVRVYPSTLELIQSLRASGVRIGLATSSRNAATVLEASGARAMFEVIIDGVVSDRLGHRGKPEPDIFLAACAMLGAEPACTIIVEDAAPGVLAGARGGFGLIVGVARHGNADELRANGADVVVGDLAELTLENIDRKVRLKAARP